MKVKTVIYNKKKSDKTYNWVRIEYDDTGLMVSTSIDKKNWVCITVVHY